MNIFILVSVLLMNGLLISSSQAVPKNPGNKISIAYGGSKKLSAYSGQVKCELHPKINQYLKMSDHDLITAAAVGIGACQVSGKCEECACPMYLKVNGVSVSSNPGKCIQSEMEAADLIRSAIEDGSCFFN